MALDEKLKVVALDLEIINEIGREYSWDRPYELGISVACTYACQWATNGMIVGGDSCKDWFGGEQAPDWKRQEIRDMVIYLQEFDRIITFNGVRFDFRVIDGYLTPGTERTPQKMSELLHGKHIDILADIHETTGRRCSLDALALGTLNEKKIGHGAWAPKAWKEGKRLEVIEYCRNDTRKTFQIWAKGEQDKEVTYVYDRPTVVRIP